MITSSYQRTGKLKLKKYILAPSVDEAAYQGNLGFEEMVEFYKVASEQEIVKLTNAIERGDWNEFKKLIYKVTGRKLK
jgi:predicted HAD superfamily Cof-like phosphohydrolase